MLLSEAREAHQELLYLDLAPPSAVDSALEHGCPKCGSSSTYEVRGNVGGTNDNVRLAICDACGHATKEGE